MAQGIASILMPAMALGVMLWTAGAKNFSTRPSTAAGRPVNWRRDDSSEASVMKDTA